MVISEMILKLVVCVCPFELYGTNSNLGMILTLSELVQFNYNSENDSETRNCNGIAPQNFCPLPLCHKFKQPPPFLLLLGWDKSENVLSASTLHLLCLLLAFFRTPLC